MNSKLILLCGATKVSTPNPPYREPYNIVWNASVAFTDLSNYVFPSSIPMYYADIHSLEPLSDYPPLDFHPTLHSDNIQGAVLGPSGLPEFITAGYDNPPFVIHRMKELGDSDRRGKLPKVFQITGFMEYGLSVIEVFRYALNDGGTKYISLELRPIDDTKYEAYILTCLDGSTEVRSNRFEVQREPNGSLYSLRMIIFGDRVVVHEGQPGTEIGSLALSEPAICNNKARLYLFYVTDFIPGPTPPGGEDVIFENGFSFLSIYDGYY